MLARRGIPVTETGTVRAGNSTRWPFLLQLDNNHHAMPDVKRQILIYDCKPRNLNNR